MKAKITVKSVEGIAPGSSDIILWDTELKGFGCKVTPVGRRTYFLYYRTREGQQRRPAIGQHGVLKPEAARDIARRWLAEVADGRDPSLSRKQDRDAPVMRKLCSRYLEEHADVRKKARSAQGDRQLIDSHILPALGAKKIASISRADVASLHRSLRDRPYAANRTLALLSKMFALSERWALRPDGSNPAKNIDKYREEKRQRYLSAHELARLWAVLDDPETLADASANAIAAIRLLILTGRRLNEILTLEWDWVDLEAKVMRLPDTKNGALVVAMAKPAVDFLLELKKGAGGGKFVVPGRIAGQRMINLQKPWRRIRAKAKLDDLRLHDLRHTFASVGAGLNMSLSLIGRLLGHSNTATTERYAHLSQDPIKIAADQIGSELMRMIAAQSTLPSAANDQPEHDRYAASHDEIPTQRSNAANDTMG